MDYYNWGRFITGQTVVWYIAYKNVNQERATGKIIIKHISWNGDVEFWVVVMVFSCQLAICVASEIHSIDFSMSLENVFPVLYTCPLLIIENEISI